MNSDSGALKGALRKELRSRLQPISAAQRSERSMRACALLRQQLVWTNARKVLFYAALPTELDLSSLLQEALLSGKSVALPRFIAETGVYGACQIDDLHRDSAPGKYGIPEPTTNCAVVDLKHLDLVLVPGVGFDASGHRLGRGQGFYDRLLAQISGIKCGVAFDEQMVQEIPAEPHDIRLNFILTPTRWHEIIG